MSNSFARGHVSLAVAFKGLNAILGLYKCNYSLTLGARSSALPPGRNKVPGWIKQGGGPDSAVGLVFAARALRFVLSFLQETNTKLAV